MPKEVPIEEDIEFWLKVPFEEKDQVKNYGAWYFPKKRQWGVPKYLNNSQKTSLNKWIDLVSKPELPRVIKELAATLAKNYLDDVVKLLPFNFKMNFKSDIPKFPLHIYNIDPRLAGSFCEYIVNRVICECTNTDYKCDQNHYNLHLDLCSDYYKTANYYRKQNDWSEAFKYYKLSYKYPNKLSAQWISYCLINGLGVEKNIDLGNNYIQKSEIKEYIDWEEDWEEEKDNIDIENIKSLILEGEQHLKEMETAYIECNNITNKTIDILPSILLMSLNHHYTFRQDTSKKDIIRKSLSTGQLNNFVKELNDMLRIEGLNKDDIKCKSFSCGGEDIIIKDTVIDYKLCNTEYRHQDILQVLLYASKINCELGRITMKKCEIWNFLEGKIYAIDLSSWDLYSQREFLQFCKIL